MEPVTWARLAVQAWVFLGILALAATGRVPRLRYVVLGIGTTVLYAAAQDQVSARLAPEYFTVLHPRLPFEVEGPTLLGLVWGWLGAWWVGAILGYVLGLTATLGPRPALSPRELLRPVGALFAAVAAATAITGVSAWRHAEMFEVGFGPGLRGLVPPERERATFVVACYHFTAYASSALGSAVLCLWVAATRRRRATAQSH